MWQSNRMRTLQEISCNKYVYFETYVNILRVNVKRNTGFEDRQKMSNKSSLGQPSEYAYTIHIGNT